MARMTSAAASSTGSAAGPVSGKGAGPVSGKGAGPGRGTRRASAGPARYPWQAVLTGVIAASAYFGALGLITGFLTLGPVVTSRLPFASPVLGGIALLAVVAIPTTVTSWLAARGDRRTGHALMLAGFLLAGWIIVQVAFIGELSFLHPLYLLAGGLLIWLGLRARPRRKSPRAQQ